MSAQYPSAAGTDANLFVAVNNLSTSLTDNPLTSGATTVNVSSTTGFPTAGYITIDAEAISYTGTTGTSFTGCTRGADGTTAASHVTASQVQHDVVAAHHNTLKDEIKAVETDLVAGMAALTPVTAASTAGSILIRLEHIISQIKNGFGLTNWYDVVTAMLPKTGGTMSGAIAMGANKVTGLANGTASTDAAAFGQVYYGFQAPVQATDASATSSSSSTFASTTTTASITPTSASHRIKITITGSFVNSNGNVANGFVSIFRGSTDLSGGGGFTRTGGTTATGIAYPCSLTFIDSPASTSATTYTVKIKNSNNSTVMVWNESGSCTSVITLEEIV